MKQQKQLVSFLMLLPAILSCIGGARYFSKLGPESWQSLDWLVSYEAGPIRRGLSGYVLREAASHFPSISVVKISFFLTVLAAFGAAYYVASRTKEMSSIQRLALGWSPCMYPVFWLYDLQGGGRKEIFAIIIVLVMSLSAEVGGRIQRYFLFLTSFILMPLLVLAHEAIFFFAVPFLLLSFMISYLDSLQALPPFGIIRKAAAKALVVSAPSLAALIFVAFHSSPGPLVFEEICRSWQSIYTSLTCSPLPGTFDMLASNEYAQGLIINSYKSPLIYKQWLAMFGYVFLLFYTCLIPVVRDSLGKIALKKRLSFELGSKILLGFVMFFGAIFTLPLYALAIDYGRWISSYVTLTVIFVIGHRNSLARISVWFPPFAQPSFFLYKIPGRKYLAIVPLLLSASLTLPHCCILLYNSPGIKYKITYLIHIVAGIL